MLTIESVFDEDGPLAACIDGYSPRVQQVAMAQAIQRAISDRDVLVCEAGTGTGKTLAYLLPVLLSRQRVIISTGTRNLQEQLFHRDLPALRRALNIPVNACMLKGRSNYLCRHRLAQARADGRFRDYRIANELQTIASWSAETKTGDIAELGEIPEDSPVWRHATSTVENCLGQACPEFSECDLFKARRRALEADVVVVNHHLFFADLAVREGGFGELLPSVDAIVLDEAHQLPDIATQFFGWRLSSSQLAELARDVRVAFNTEAGDIEGFLDLLTRVEEAVAAAIDVFGGRPERISWEAANERRGVPGAISELMESLAALRDGLELIAQRGKSLESCYQRCASNHATLCALRDREDAQRIYWLEVRQNGFTWHASPLEVGSLFSSWVEAADAAWILASATLAVGDSLDHFSQRLGIDYATTHIWESPFDYRHQSLCYLPPDMPEPRAPGYVEKLNNVIVTVLTASRGRAFVLFTSHQMLRQCAAQLKTELEFPVFVQGDTGRSKLLRQFRQTANSVLFGTYGFWEGVDVRGAALSCVIIDKLPFAPPDEPVLLARCNALRANGGQPFMEIQLPQAVIGLKQGVGRLIRDASDFGAVVLCDPRLTSKGYGKIFLASLPPMPITRDIADLQAFFDAH